MKWLYAGYKKGAFPAIERDLGPKDFDREFRASAGGSTIFFTLLAPVDGKVIPIGLVGAEVRGKTMEPHAAWFKWASPRNKLTSLVNIGNEIRKVFTILVVAKEDSRAMYVQLCRYGLGRQVGKIHDYFEDGDTVSLFQSRK